jgi:hypothetical protein
MMRRRSFPDSGISSVGGLAGLAEAAGFAAGLGGVATTDGAGAFGEAVEGASSEFAMREAPLINTGLYSSCLKIQPKDLI